MPQPFSFPRPDWVRRLNYLGDSVGGAANLVSLDADEMLHVAQRSLGLTDFGDHWGTEWRDAYYKLVQSYDEQAQLNTLGRLATRQDFIRTLRTRLLVADAHRRQPELEQVDIVEPVFIVGQSRTGTTIIHELMSLDPQLRAPLAWEMIHPIEWADAPPVARQLLAECEQDFFADVVPEFAAVHELRADLPMECVLMMALEFSGGWAATTGDVSDFLAWRAETDPVPSYRMHKRFLQVLQGHGQAQWLLKSPAHLMQLPALFEVYPDAKIVHTHRDPIKTIASTISTVATSQFVRSDQVSTDTNAFAIPIGFQMSLEAGIDQRTNGQLPAERIADVLYQDFMQDQSGALKVAYDKLGLEFDAQLASIMRSYLQDKPQGKFGRHHYALEDFGLNADDIRAQFARYVAHYGIEEGI